MGSVASSVRGRRTSGSPSTHSAEVKEKKGSEQAEASGREQAISGNEPQCSKALEGVLAATCEPAIDGLWYLSRLPPEVLEMIVSRCPAFSLGYLRRVCRKLKEAVDAYVQHLPRSAAELKRRAAGRILVDGEYHLGLKTIEFGVVPLQVYCSGMSTSEPEEYITLKHVGKKHNSGQIKSGGTVDGTDIRTIFEKVRICLHGKELRVLCTDFTFSYTQGERATVHTGNGSLTTLFEHMPLGVAMTSGSFKDASAFIDLRGTGLRVDCSFRAFGFSGHGVSATSHHFQVVSIRGSGYTGGCGPRLALGAHNSTMSLGSNPLQAERVWREFVPISMKVAIAGTDGAARKKPFTLESRFGSTSWNEIGNPE